MKYLLVLLVVGVVVWMLVSRQRSRDPGRDRPRRTRTDKPAAMLACAHCGVLLPPDEALKDNAGRFFCSEAHRLAGPP